MNKTLKLVLILVAGVIIGFLATFFLGSNLGSNQVSAPVGGVTNYGGGLTIDSIQVGSGETTISNLNAGTCYLRPYATTITASTTANVDCQGTLAWNANSTANTSALTGISMGDWVVASLSTTTTGTTVQGLRLGGASASTTAGYIVLRIINQTGTTYTWPTTSGLASGTASYISGN